MLNGSSQNGGIARSISGSSWIDMSGKLSHTGILRSVQPHGGVFSLFFGPAHQAGPRGVGVLRLRNRGQINWFFFVYFFSAVLR
jgi:hypothetical protein